LKSNIVTAKQIRIVDSELFVKEVLLIDDALNKVQIIDSEEARQKSEDEEECLNRRSLAACRTTTTHNQILFILRVYSASLRLSKERLRIYGGPKTE